MLGLRSILTWLLPEMPNWLAAEIARAEHCRRQMQCKGVVQRPTPPTPPSSLSTPADQPIPTSLGMDIGETTTTTNEQSLDSQHSEELIDSGEVNALDQIDYPPQDQLPFSRSINKLASELHLPIKRESSPDSQPSQVSNN